MGASGKRIKNKHLDKLNSAPQVNPNSYFEQLEPRIILGSCLALGGAEALLSQAHAAETDPLVFASPPPDFGHLNPQNNFGPATDVPRLLRELQKACPICRESLRSGFLLRPAAPTSPTS